MNSNEALRALADVRDSLASMLSVFEAETPDAPVLEGALRRSAETFQVFEELRGETARGELAPEVLEAMEHCQRLNALVVALLGDRRADLAHERSLIQRARLHLQELKSVASSGGSCDIAG